MNNDEATRHALPMRGKLILTYGIDDFHEWVTLHTNLELTNEFMWEILDSLQATKFFKNMFLLGTRDGIRASKDEANESGWEIVEPVIIQMVIRKIIKAGYAEVIQVTAQYSDWPKPIGICQHCKQIEGVDITIYQEADTTHVGLTSGGDLREPDVITAKVAEHREQHHKKGVSHGTCQGSGKPPAMGSVALPKLRIIRNSSDGVPPNQK